MSSNVINSPNLINKSPDNFLSKSKIQTFRKLGRKGSIYNLIKEAKSIKTSILELSQKNVSSQVSSHHSNVMESNSSIPSDTKKFKLSLKEEDNNIINNLDFKHKYKQNEL